MSATVFDNRPLSRFELRVGGDTAFITYLRAAEQITLLHAEVPPHLSGKGLGTEMTRAVLDALRAEGTRVRIRCPFIAAFVEHHPEYQALLAD